MVHFPRTFTARFGLVWVVVIAGLLLKAEVMGSIGHIGPDSDDVMRLVQIRDFLAGQSWFDPVQARMGPGGTEMHWSRLVDLPIICLIQFFDLFVSSDMAEMIAIAIWPPLSSGLVIWGVMVGARNLSLDKTQDLTQGFAAVLLLFLLIPHFRFAPGAIDHHNFQLGLMAIAVGYAADPDLRARSFAFSAIALALSIAIGIEVNAFAAVLCGFTGVIWWVRGEAARKATAAFGIAFALTLWAVFFLTISPQNYGRVTCDALSLITVTAGGAGGGAVALTAWFASGRNFIWRTVALVGVGLLCAAILTLQAPQCLSNPLGSLPPEMKELWLGNIEEAQPLLADRDQWFSLVPFAIGTTILAIGLAVANILRRERPVIHGGIALLLLVVVLLTLYQTRFYVFGPVIAIPVLAVWIAKVYRRTRTEEAKSPVYIFALAVSLPVVWGFPGLMLMPSGKAPQVARVNMCYSEPVLAAISALEPGLIAATPNGTAPVLSQTQHSALSGNYHRNVDGIMAGIHIFTSSPEVARKEIIKSGVNYIHACGGAEDGQTLALHNPDGLMSQLLGGNVPDYLTPLDLGLKSESVMVYKVDLKVQN